MVRSLEKMGHLLTIAGEEEYKAPAYYRAARQVKRYPGDLEELLEGGRITEIPGVGPALASKIEEIRSGGSFRALDQIQDRLPSDVLGLIDIPGIGARTAGKLYRELGVENPGDLERAIQSQQVRKVGGLGPKREEQLAQALRAYFRHQSILPLYRARWVASQLAGHLEKMESVIDCWLTGDARRGSPEVTRVEMVVVTAPDGSPQLPTPEELGAPGARLIPASPSSAGLVRLITTGSEQHVARLRELAGRRGLVLEEEGAGIEAGDEWAEDETGVYGRLDLPFIPPELRETGREIDAALDGQLPRLLGPGDIRGDLHLHTSWSDGVHRLEEMVSAALDLGYDYLAVTDHSQSLSIARGLDPARLRQQGAEIREMRESVSGFQILAGSEVDILPDGSLDFEPELLELLDLVVGSIHTAFSLSPGQQTRRLVAACENPHVDVIAHPSGRVLGYREGYGADMDELIDAAARTGTALEINATPDRMDLDDRHAGRAAAKGVLLAINSDAHSRVALPDLSYGITVARRAWLGPEQIVNAWPWPRFRRWLRASKTERAAMGRDIR